MRLFAVRCMFQAEKHTMPVHGVAICSDPDTPVTFIYPDGRPYKGEEIWNYKLNHLHPWTDLGEFT